MGGCAAAAGGPGGNPPPQPFSLSLTPSTITLRGLTSQQFTAKASDNSTPALTWSVNGVAGGNAATGTISATGQFTAPEFPPTPSTVTVQAALTTDSSKSASGVVTLQNPTPQLTTLTPTSIPVGAFTLNLTGAHFASNAVAYFGSTALATTVVSSTQITATGTATTSEAGSVTVLVKNLDPGGTSVTSSGLLAQVTQPVSNISVSVFPPTATIRAGSSETFSATVTNTTNTAVSWLVNGVAGGNTTLGTIDNFGDYTAPTNLPTPNTVTVTATSAQDTTKSGNAGITLQNPVPVLTSAAPGMLATGAFQLALYGSGFVNTSSVNFGGQTLASNFASPNMITITGNIPSTQTGSISLSVSNPNPGAGTSSSISVQIATGGTPTSSAAANRFLEQSSFGPNTESMNQLQQAGFDIYLQNQFAATVSPYPDPLNNIMNPSTSQLQPQFFLNAIYGGDQLRQRVALALNEIWVTAGDKISDPAGYTNYIRILNQDALGNYLDVMHDVTLTPAMGHYLDMVNNDAPAPGQHANENYAREFMQLMCLGLNQLNPDGSFVVDSTGTPVPTYTQDDVMALGRAFTGWTYPATPGMPSQNHNPEYYRGPMVPVEAKHDMSAKTLLGQTIPAGQTAEADLTSALNIVFNHPNVGPFVGRQLILKLVTSNPSPAYIQHVTQAFNTGSFNGYGSGTRGDLRATVAAVLLDPEARRGDSPATTVLTDGKLREPVIMEVALARAFHVQTDGSGFSSRGASMSQNIFYSPSVFNFFPPVSPIAGTTLNGPEFAIFNTASSLSRVNFVNSIVYGGISSNTKFDFTPVSTAGTPDQMLAWLNTMFLHSSMADQMKQTILTAVNAVDPTKPAAQAQAAIYLVTSSSMYQVQH
jgi:uncharacterized protein (DUF1800 family)